MDRQMSGCGSSVISPFCSVLLFSARAVVLLIALVAVLPSKTFAQSDRLPGISLPNFKVNNNGASAVTIPIIASPGTNGIAPRLALQYDSQKQTGLLGMGWSLEGLPVIQRCRANKPQDGYMGGVNFDAKDRFCLESARLIALVDGTDGG